MSLFLDQEEIQILSNKMIEWVVLNFEDSALSILTF